MLAGVDFAAGANRRRSRRCWRRLVRKFCGQLGQELAGFRGENLGFCCRCGEWRQSLMSKSMVSLMRDAFSGLLGSETDELSEADQPGCCQHCAESASTASWR